MIGSISCLLKTHMVDIFKMHLLPQYISTHVEGFFRTKCMLMSDRGLVFISKKENQLIWPYGVTYRPLHAIIKVSIFTAKRFYEDLFLLCMLENKSLQENDKNALFTQYHLCCFMIRLIDYNALPTIFC